MMLDLLVVAAFLAITLGAGWRSRRQASKGLDEFLLAGRGLRGWQAGTSMAATQFAADTPLVTVGLIATSGVFMIWRFWIYGLAFLVLAFLFAGHWQRAGVLTDAQLAETRYAGRGTLLLRVVKALFYGLVFNCIVIAWVLLATLVIAEVLLPWHAWLPGGLHGWWVSVVDGLGITFVAPGSTLDESVASANNVLSLLLVLVFVALYSTTGGLRSVVVTDLTQFALALIGSTALAVILVREAGGLGDVVRGVETLYTDEAGYGDRDADHLLGFVPPPGPVLLPFIALMAMQWVFQSNADGTGYLAQRAMACRDERESRIAGVLFAWLQIFLRSLPWIVIGVALLVVYPFTPADAAADGFAADRERLFVQAVADHMPPGLYGIMLVALLAALASTLDSHMNWGASYWANDLYDRWLCRGMLRREPGERELVLVARLSNVLVVAVGLAIVPFLESIQQVWKISLLFGAGVGGVLVLRWLWERISAWSELGAMIVSVVAAPIMLGLTDRGPIPDGDEGEWIRLGLVALISTTTAIVIALLTPTTESRRAARIAFYERVRPAGWWPDAAAAVGESPGAPMRRLGREVIGVALTGASLYLALYGAVRLLLLRSDGHLLAPLLAIAAGLALVPVWWPFMRRPEA